jgi:ribosomal protein L12E/L44/L45/RPP1/RPP2
MSSLSKIIEGPIKELVSTILASVVDVVIDNIDSFTEEDPDKNELAELLASKLEIDAPEEDDKKSRTSASNIGSKLKGLGKGPAKGTTKKSSSKKGSSSSVQQLLSLEEFVEALGDNPEEANLCCYAFGRGKNKHKFCGANANAVNNTNSDNYKEFRCTKCAEKVNSTNIELLEGGKTGPTKRLNNKKAVAGVSARKTKTTGDKPKPSSTKKKNDDDDDEDEEDEDEDEGMSIKAIKNESLTKLLGADHVILTNEGLEGSIVHYGDSNQDGIIYGKYKGKQPLTSKTKINKSI